MSGTRLNKFLSEVGYCSRREGDQLIAAQRVTINGVVPELGTKVQPGDVVRVDGHPVQERSQEHVYIAYNKPLGIISTTDTRIKDNIIDAVNYPTRIFPIGRLDKPSEGLILLTDDGDIVNKLLRARYNHEKEYLVTVDRPITAKFLRKMRAGVPILDTVTQPCVVTKVSERCFRIILTQGLNRQIRRMCQHLSFRVVALKRIRIVNIHLDLEPGQWRPLRQTELAELQRRLESPRQVSTPRRRPNTERRDRGNPRRRARGR